MSRRRYRLNPPTDMTGPFVMSVEFQTPADEAPTYRLPYEEVATIEEAIAWIERPPLPAASLKKLKKGVLLTARVPAEWVMENGQQGEEIAAMGRVLRVGTRTTPTTIALVTRDGISVGGKRVGAEALGLTKKVTGDVAEALGLTKKVAGDVVAWLASESTAQTLLRACDGVPRQLLVLTACAVARTVLYLVPAGEDRPRVAIETAEEWAYGRASLDHVKKAEEAAWDARDDRAADRAAWVSWAAARAAWAAKDAAGNAAWAATRAAAGNAAGDAARAAWVAKDAARAAGSADARIVREWVGLPEVVFAAITRKK